MPATLTNGLEVETVADIIGDTSEFLEVETALAMPVLETTVPIPRVGIHFGMTDEAYHALPCASKSHLRNLLCSPTMFWSESWLNPNRVEKTKDHLTVGKAYHAMILEGPKAYGARFYTKPDPREYPKAIKLVDEIKQAIVERDHKPVVNVDLTDQPGKTRKATKDDWVAQLVRIDRSVEVWDDIVARADRAAAGRELISSDDDRRIRVAARMISQDPQLVKAFRGGYAEVTLIWRDPRQGVLMKARIDYLKLMAVVDLKSFANSRDRSVRNAIIRAIAENKYALQPAVYLQGVDEVRKLIRQHGAGAIHFHCWNNVENPEHVEKTMEAQTFALKWAQVEAPDRWLWVFQQKGDAPVTRGLYHPLASTTHSFARGMIQEAQRTFRECAEIYGTDPWLDLAEIDELGDEEIPAWGLEI